MECSGVVTIVALLRLARSRKPSTPRSAFTPSTASTHCQVSESRGMFLDGCPTRSMHTATRCAGGASRPVASRRSVGTGYGRPHVGWPSTFGEPTTPIASRCSAPLLKRGSPLALGRTLTWPCGDSIRRTTSRRSPGSKVRPLRFESIWFASGSVPSRSAR